MARRLKPAQNGTVIKLEDKAWQEWFDNLGVKEHENYLSKLGLDEEDIEEWEEAKGLKKPIKAKKPVKAAKAKKAKTRKAKG